MNPNDGSVKPTVARVLGLRSLPILHRPNSEGRWLRRDGDTISQEWVVSHCAYRRLNAVDAAGFPRMIGRGSVY